MTPSPAHRTFKLYHGPNGHTEMNEPLFRVSVESSSTNEVYWQTEWTDRDDALDIHTDALERISEADDDTIVRWHKKQD